jgi:hypothetical protein
MHAQARRLHRVFLAGLAAVACLLSGCVYLRLLEVKRQLAAFDRFFALETTDGVRLACLTPVLLTGDFRWLGIVPESTKRLGQSEQWRVRWVKEVPANTSENVIRDVEIELIFTEDKLTRLHIPEAYFALIPKEFLIGLIRGLGSADIDRGRRDAAVSFRTHQDMLVAQVTATSLAMLLGKPSQQSVEGTRTTLRYRYVPTPPGARNGVFDLSFVFDTASGQLVFLQGRSPVGQMSFTFEPTTPKKAAGPKK